MTVNCEKEEAEKCITCFQIFVFHMFACNNYVKLIQKNHILCAAMFLSGGRGVVLDSESSPISVNIVFTRHCCLLRGLEV
jgi:hypothetical protein